jgi:hypothetical protein
MTELSSKTLARILTDGDGNPARLGVSRRRINQTLLLLVAASLLLLGGLQWI